MNRKTLPEIKNSKPFYLFDLLIYCLLAVIICLLFSWGVTAENNGATYGFYVLYDNKVIAEYRYENGNFNVTNGCEDHFKINGNEIRFYPDDADKNEYNIIIIDNLSKTVYVSEATCTGHDCENQRITDGKGFIYCAPHKLKITPMGLQSPVTG